MANARVLIVEDDFSIASNVHLYLERRSFEVDLAYTGHSALHRLSVERFDCILLDIGLPGLDGHTILRRIREELQLTTPVMIVSARTEQPDKLAGFKHGADDYITKPFALGELEARIHALLRRASPAASNALRRFGSLVFDMHAHEARINDTHIRLAPKTAALLELLMRSPGKLLKRAEIEGALWSDEPPHPDALRTQVHSLRKALLEAGFGGSVETVHGVGYKIVDRRSSSQM